MGKIECNILSTKIYSIYCGRARDHLPDFAEERQKRPKTYTTDSSPIAFFDLFWSFSTIEKIFDIQLVVHSPLCVEKISDLATEIFDITTRPRITTRNVGIDRF